MSKQNLFRSGALHTHELVDFGMGPDSVGMFESAQEPTPAPTPEPTPAPAPAPASEPTPAPAPEPAPAPGAHTHTITTPAPTPAPAPAPTPAPQPEIMTESAKNEAFMEAVAAKTAQDDKGMAAASIIDWANGDKSADGLDALAASLAGIDTDSDADITDEDVDNYNYWLGLLADAAVALGADQADVTAAIDEDDDDAASVVADAISGKSDDADAAIAQHQLMTESCAMFEASVKVVRQGKVVLIKKRPRPRRMTAAQRNALKKNARRAHSAAAELQRLKSMKKRRSAGL